MNATEYRVQLVEAWTIAHLVRSSGAGEALAAAQYADGIGPMLDPTLYQKNARKLQEDMTMLGIINDARNALVRAFPSKAGDK